MPPTEQRSLDGSDESDEVSELPHGMAPANPLEVVEAFGAAWSAHDLSAALAMITDDCLFDATGPAPDGTASVGPDAIGTVWAPIFNDPGSHFAVEETFPAGDRVVQRWRYSFPGGHVRGVDLFRVPGRQGGREALVRQGLRRPTGPLARTRLVGPDAGAPPPAVRPQGGWCGPTPLSSETRPRSGAIPARAVRFGQMPTRHPASGGPGLPLRAPLRRNGPGQADREHRTRRGFRRRGPPPGRRAGPATPTRTDTYRCPADAGRDPRRRGPSRPEDPIALDRRPQFAWPGRPAVPGPDGPVGVDHLGRGRHRHVVGPERRLDPTPHDLLVGISAHRVSGDEQLPLVAVGADHQGNAG